jgi:hypothetical protein
LACPWRIRKSRRDRQNCRPRAATRRSANAESGIAQVAKGTEVPTEAKYELENGKLMLSVYTSAKGFDTAPEDRSGAGRVNRCRISFEIGIQNFGA